MSYKVFLSRSFKRSLKSLLKRFPHAKDDVSLALGEVVQTPTLGVMVPKSGGVRKVRVRSSDMPKGKSGGFRLLYLVLSDRRLICPLLVYAKSEREDVTIREIRALLADLAQDLEP